MTSPATRSIHIAQIGCGGWGRHVLRDLLELGAQVSVVAPSEATRERALAAGASSALARIDQIGEVDGAVVVTPTSTHAEVLSRLFAHRPGIPVFCEKPLTDDPAGAAELADAAAGHLFVMDKWRYHPGVVELAAIARSGELGEVVGLRLVRSSWGNHHRDVSMIWTLAPHDLAIALEVLGEVPEPRSAVLDTDRGEPVGLIARLGDQPWTVLEAGSRSLRRTREVTLYCSRGVATLADPMADHILVAPTEQGLPPEPSEPERRAIAGTMPLYAELAAYCAYLAGAGGPPKSSAAEGAEIVSAVSRCIELGRT